MTHTDIDPALPDCIRELAVSVGTAAQASSPRSMTDIHGVLHHTARMAEIIDGFSRVGMSDVPQGAEPSAEALFLAALAADSEAAMQRRTQVERAADEEEEEGGEPDSDLEDEEEGASPEEEDLSEDEAELEQDGSSSEGEEESEEEDEAGEASLCSQALRRHKDMPDKEVSLYSKARKADMSMPTFKGYVKTQQLDGLYANPQRPSQTVLSTPTQVSQTIMQDAVDYHGIDGDGVKESLSLEHLQEVAGLMEQIRRVTAKHHLGVENDQLPTVGVPVDPFQFIPQAAHHLLVRLGTMSRTAYDYVLVRTSQSFMPPTIGVPSIQQVRDKDHHVRVVSSSYPSNSMQTYHFVLAPVKTLEYENTKQAAKDPTKVTPEAVFLVDALWQLQSYQNGRKIQPHLILLSLRVDVQVAIIHTADSLLALVHRSVEAELERIQHPQLKYAPDCRLVVEVKGNFARDHVLSSLRQMLPKHTTVRVHYHFEFGRADYVSEHAPEVLERCDLQACERLQDQGIAAADEGVWANWQRLYPMKHQRRIAERLERCSCGGFAVQRQAALVKSFLMTEFFKKMPDQERDVWSAGGVGAKLGVAIQSLLDSPDHAVKLAKEGIEPGIASLRGFVKGGKEKHKRAELVLVLSTCYRSKASEEEQAVFDSATAAQRLETVLVWLEEGGVEAVKAVQDAGIPNKALFKGVSSLRDFVKGGKEKHKRAELVRLVLSTCYRRKASEEEQTAFDSATAGQRLETVFMWLEEGGTEVVKVVEEAGIPKKAFQGGLIPQILCRGRQRGRTREQYQVPTQFTRRECLGRLSQTCWRGTIEPNGQPLFDGRS